MQGCMHSPCEGHPAQEVLLPQSLRRQMQRRDMQVRPWIRRRSLDAQGLMQQGLRQPQEAVHRSAGELARQMEGAHKALIRQQGQW